MRLSAGSKLPRAVVGSRDHIPIPLHCCPASRCPWLTYASIRTSLCASCSASASGGDLEAYKGMAAADGEPSLWKRVLSIQSHVVHGYVGNKCCVFPLQILGYEVDNINSVQFSNHTGYPSFKGSVTSPEQLWDLIEGLKANGLANYSHLVTGYIGSVALLDTIQRVVKTLRELNPTLTYVCDPVMGDDGKLYLPAEMVPLYRSTIVPLASIMSPNQFEAEQLTETTIQTQQDALQACNTLLQRGPQTVVLTSFSVADDADSLWLIASTRLPQRQGSWPSLKLHIPRLDASFTGTGDLLTALLLAWLDRYPDDLKQAVETAIASLQGIVQRTYESVGDAVKTDSESAEVMKRRELQLIQNQDVLRRPEIQLRATKMQ